MAIWRECCLTLRSNAPLLRQELQAAEYFHWETLTPQVRRTRAEWKAMTERDFAEEKAMKVRRVS